LRFERSRVQLPAVPLSGNDISKLFTRHVPLSPSKFGISHGAAMSCDWEGNRTSGVALTMRHRLEWFIHLHAQGLSKGNEHPTNTSHEVLFTFTLPSWASRMSVLNSLCDCDLFYIIIYIFISFAKTQPININRYCSYAAL